MPLLAPHPPPLKKEKKKRVVRKERIAQITKGENSLSLGSKRQREFRIKNLTSQVAVDVTMISTHVNVSININVNIGCKCLQCT